MSKIDQILLLYVITSIFLCVISIPLILRRIGPNLIYGFRFLPLLKNKELWLEVNAYGGKWLLGIGVVTLIATLVLRQVPGLTLDVYAMTLVMVVTAGIVVGLVQTLRYMTEVQNRKG